MGQLFTIEPAPTFPATVQITAPGGARRPLEVEYRVMGKAALKAYRAQVEARPESEEPDILLDILAGWRADAPLTRDGVAALLDANPRAGEELWLAWLAGLAGERLGN